MLKSVSIEEIDHLLHELERLAHSASRKRFFDTALERLRFLLSAQGACVRVRATPEQWVTIAQSGSVHADPLDPLPEQAAQVEFWTSADRRILAVPIRKLPDGEAQWQRGALLIELDQPPSQSEAVELARLCDAFAEVLAMRQWSELEDLLDRRWLSFQKSLAYLANSNSVEEAAYSIVNDLAALVKADRVSLVQAGALAPPRMLAISGVIQPNRKAAATLAMGKICQESIQQQLPLARHVAQQDALEGKNELPSGPSQHLLDNYVCIPIVSHRGSRETECSVAVLVEWSEYDGFVFGCGTLNYVLPAFAASWVQHQRWLSIPSAVRRMFAFRRPGGLKQWKHRGSRLAVALLLGLMLLAALNIPTRLRIEAQGTLQPVEQRIVFAPLDGIVEQIVAGDGQQVAAGEPLLEMRSPMLEIEIQQVQGEIRANAEKRDGLHVAINQSANDTIAHALQSKLSSEIRELETQLETLEQKQLALLNEWRKLTITSPIAGVVVARQIERLLDSRPVRRGDSLLRVVQLNGPWQLELLVADRDAGYVKRKMFQGHESSSGAIPATAPRQIDFVVASQPDQPLRAQATWMSESARSPQGEEVVVDVLADVDEAVAARGHMGATVSAYFDCGQKPFWFVWSRPMLEAIQRRLWF